MTTVGEANRQRMCIDCGTPGAQLLTDHTDRILRICDACLQRGDWYVFGLRSRGPIVEEVPTEYIEGEWCWPTDTSDPWAIVTPAVERCSQDGFNRWQWWALGTMGDADSYDAACRAAEAAVLTAAERKSLERCDDHGGA